SSSLVTSFSSDSSSLVTSFSSDSSFSSLSLEVSSSSFSLSSSFVFKSDNSSKTEANLSLIEVISSFNSSKAISSSCNSDGGSTSSTTSIPRAAIVDCEYAGFFTTETSKSSKSSIVLSYKPFSIDFQLSLITLKPNDMFL